MTREEAILLMRKKAEELGRFPKKSDFDTLTVSRIKAFLGPWPRALEAAGVKEPDPERIARKREKRLRARRNQMKYRKEHPKEQPQRKED